jgi:hypothetical protein
MKSSPAVTIALDHIQAWSCHDWVKTRELLAPDVRALVASTIPDFVTTEFTGADRYMELKVPAARLVEPGSVQVLASVGDETNALTLVTFRIAMGPGGTLLTMARSCLYSIDENHKIKDERDTFFFLSQRASSS